MLLVAAPAEFAQPPAHASIEAAKAVLFPGQEAWEWARATADFNGDGLDDVALMLVVSGGDLPSTPRLVVLAGTPDHGYTPMSASGSYCNAQTFFNLEAKGASLWVSAVHRADAGGQGSDTLQFRFNKRVDDLDSSAMRSRGKRTREGRPVASAAGSMVGRATTT